MASRVGPSSFYVQRPFEVLSTNVLIDTQILRASVDSGVARYFYPSSVFVYPLERQRDPEAAPLREEEGIPANPPVSYGWAKIIGEKAVEYAVHENPRFRAAIGRLIGVYGPGQDIDLQRGSIIPVLLRRAFEYPKTPFSIRGNGEETRSYCYIDDVADAVILSVEKLDQQPMIGPLNIGSEGRIKIVDLAKEVIRTSGKDIRIEWLPGEPSVWGQSIDSSAKVALNGWEPKVRLEEGLRRTYRYVSERLQNFRTDRSLEV
jgi:nucleoside-diphosphate-sugar epimerase